MKNMLQPTYNAAHGCIPTKTRAKRTVHWQFIAVKGKRDNMTKVSLLFGKKKQKYGIQVNLITLLRLCNAAYIYIYIYIYIYCPSSQSYPTLNRENSKESFKRLSRESFDNFTYSDNPSNPGKSNFKIYWGNNVFRRFFPRHYVAYSFPR